VLGKKQQYTCKLQIRVCEVEMEEGIIVAAKDYIHDLFKSNSLGIEKCPKV